MTVNFGKYPSQKYFPILIDYDNLTPMKNSEQDRACKIN